MKVYELISKIDESIRKGNKKEACKFQIQLAFKLNRIDAETGDSVSSLISNNNGTLNDISFVIDNMSILDMNIPADKMISAMQAWLKDENPEAVKAIVEAAYMAYVK